MSKDTIAFLLTNSPGEAGDYSATLVKSTAFKQVVELQKDMTTQFKGTWFSQVSEELVTPTIIVVEDNALKLEEVDRLSQHARLVIPTSYRVVEQEVGIKLKVQTKQADKILSVKFFDEGFHPAEITLFDFLMDTSHEIISFTMLKNLQHFWKT